MSSPPKTAVIGAGCTGVFAALALARRGHLVTIFDPDGAASHASGQNPGGLNPLYGPGIPGPLTALASEAFALHRETWESLEPDGLWDGRIKQRLNLAFDESDVDRLGTMAQWYTAASGFSAEWLDPAEVHHMQSGVAESVQGGLLVGGDGRVSAPHYVRAVLDLAVGLGATLAHERVTGIAATAGAVHAVTTATGSYDCDGVVVATGPWSDGPASWLDLELPVSPLKGEMILVETSEPLSIDLAWRSGALYHAGKDRIWLAGTEHARGFDEEPSEAGLDEILRLTTHMMPAVQEFTIVDRWAALRPMTPDGSPIIGLAPGWDNVCLATAGGRKGMLFSAAMGHAAADLLDEGTTDLSIEPCAPLRFAPRNRQSSNINP